MVVVGVVRVLLAVLHKLQHQIMAARGEQELRLPFQALQSLTLVEVVGLFKVAHPRLVEQEDLAVAEPEGQELPVQQEVQTQVVVVAEGEPPEHQEQAAQAS